MTDDARALADILAEMNRHKSYWSMDDHLFFDRVVAALRRTAPDAPVTGSLADEIAYSLRTEGVFHLYQGKGEIILAALRRTAPVAGRDRETLRKLVDIVWNEATESKAVPSTKWADKLIDKALALSQPAETPVGETPCKYWDENGCYCVAGTMCSCKPETPAAIAEVREALRPFVETMSRMTAAKMIDPTLGPFAPIEVTVTKHQFFTARAALALPAGRVDE